MEMVRTDLRVQTGTRKPKPTLTDLVATYKSRALLRSQSIGRGVPLRNIGILAMFCFGSTSLVRDAVILFALSRLAGYIAEKRTVNDIAAQVRTQDHKATLARLMEDELTTAEEDRLTRKLAARGVEISKTTETVKEIYDNNYATPRIWSLGAGKRFFNLFWNAAIWATSPIPYIAGKMALLSCAKYAAILTAGLFVFSWIYGRVKERAFIKQQPPEIRQELMKDKVN